MREYSFNYDVHIFDTDCYGVVWHGSYAKWLEMGRVNLFKTIDLDMTEMSSKHDIVFPVTEQNIRFKASARFGDVLRLNTRVEPESTGIHSGNSGSPFRQARCRSPDGRGYDK
jgi:acyl-CoA thioester hydrolase